MNIKENISGITDYDEEQRSAYEEVLSGTDNWSDLFKALKVLSRDDNAEKIENALNKARKEWRLQGHQDSFDFESRVKFEQGDLPPSVVECIDRYIKEEKALYKRDNIDRTVLLDLWNNSGKSSYGIENLKKISTWQIKRFVAEKTVLKAFETALYTIYRNKFKDDFDEKFNKDWGIFLDVLLENLDDELD